MSCAQIALVELGMKYDKYYASEIDKHAIKQTQLNFPETIQLGDIESWRTWDIDWASIDLVLAGTPCTGFSFAGKQLAFDDPQSRLFFVFVDILNHVKGLNPDVKFLLENVNMKRSHMKVITDHCGVYPVNINSNLVSAQNRNRWYWTNIRIKQVGLFGEIHADIPQPEDRGILLRDILEKDVDEKYYISEATINRILKASPRIIPEKSYCIMSSNRESKRSMTLVFDTNGKPKKSQDKASCLMAGAHSGGNHSDMGKYWITKGQRHIIQIPRRRSQFWRRYIYSSKGKRF
jgi:DNA (cytosine-5)-methyltransferase 3A